MSVRACEPTRLRFFVAFLASRNTRVSSFLFLLGFIHVPWSANRFRFEIYRKRIGQLVSRIFSLQLEVCFRVRILYDEVGERRKRIFSFSFFKNLDK